MPMLELSISCHNQFAVTVNNNKTVAELLASIIGASFIDSDEYKIKTKAKAFLQSYDENNGWALVEFWTDDFDACQEFVNFCNKRIKECTNVH